MIREEADPFDKEVNEATYLSQFDPSQWPYGDIAPGYAEERDGD